MSSEITRVPEGDKPMKKRRRQRKRSRKSKGSQMIHSDTQAREPRDESVDSCDSSFSHGICKDEIFIEDHGGNSSPSNETKVCGCQVQSDVHRKRRRRRSRRRKKKLEVFDIIACETVEDYVHDDCCNGQEFEFVVPAFKVRQRCEHPMYVPHKPSKSVPDQKSKEAADNSDNYMRKDEKNPSKSANIGRQTLSGNGSSGAVSNSGVTGDNRRAAPYRTIEDITVPVNGIEDIDVGDIIYFDQLTLRDCEPVIQQQKAKVFLKLKNLEDSTKTSVLIRTYVSFDALNAATWCLKEDCLNPEPFIVSVEDLYKIRKFIPI